MEEVIHEYVRERIPGRGKQIVGVIAGTVQEGNIVVGWSKCNWKEGDTFDKSNGYSMAVRRAHGIEPTPELPVQMVNQAREFQIRCLKYFKQTHIVDFKRPSA